MARKTEDNITLIVIVGLGAYVLYRQFAKRASAATLPVASLPAPVAARPSTGSASPMPSSNLPRGIRNNNPGNIKISGNAWRGKIGNDGTFERFDSPVNGIRAAFVLLRTYMQQYGLNTIAKIGARWAPVGSGEAGNAGWAGGVSQYSSIAANTPLNITNASQMYALMRGIIAQENGARYANYYPASVIQQAYGAM